MQRRLIQLLVPRRRILLQLLVLCSSTSQSTTAFQSLAQVQRKIHQYHYHHYYHHHRSYDCYDHGRRMCAGSRRIQAPVYLQLEPKRQRTTSNRGEQLQLHNTQNGTSVVNNVHSIVHNTNSSIIFNYDVSEVLSQGIVSTLTDVVNFIFDLIQDWTKSMAFQQQQPPSTHQNHTQQQQQQQELDVILPPKSVQELMERIRDDYTVHNYLWTGELDVRNNFIESCTFTDPTLSFVGTDTYIRNIQNLRTIVNLVVSDINQECQSDLLDIQVHSNSNNNDNNSGVGIDNSNNNDYKQYIQTRWNMKGTLSKLPWKPRINVIGQTKFWYTTTSITKESYISSSNDDDNESTYKSTKNNYYQIYLYDEVWEIPSYQALLQLITPGGGGDDW